MKTILIIAAIGALLSQPAIAVVVPAPPVRSGPTTSCPFQIPGQLLFVNLAALQTFSVSVDRNGVTFTAYFKLTGLSLIEHKLRDFEQADRFYATVFKAAQECR